MMARCSRFNSISGPCLTSMRSTFFDEGTNQGRELASIRYKSFDSSQCRYGIGIVGSGGTPHIAVAHGGSGGVGIRKSFPWVAAVPPVMLTPVNVLLSGNGVV